jgi:hypothetical protein
MENDTSLVVADTDRFSCHCHKPIHHAVCSCCQPLTSLLRPVAWCCGVGHALQCAHACGEGVRLQANTNS